MGFEDIGDVVIKMLVKTCSVNNFYLSINIYNL